MKNLFPILVFFSSCIPTVKHKTFISTPTNATKINQMSISPLRLDGAYYTIETTSKDSPGEHCLHYFFFYSNGIAAEGSLCQNQKFSTDNLILSKMIADDFAKADKAEAFGGYRIEQTRVTIQIIKYFHWLLWSPTTYSGEIITENSFSKLKRYNKEWKINDTQNDRYQFILMEKPDSSIGNRWMKKPWYWKKQD